jgi:hypothetical protein
MKRSKSRKRKMPDVRRRNRTSRKLALLNPSYPILR